jgi:hypothetical protein
LECFEKFWTVNLGVLVHEGKKKSVTSRVDEYRWYKWKAMTISVVRKKQYRGGCYALEYFDINRFSIFGCTNT